MDWNKSKSMFIIVFLILDIYLLTQFYNQYLESKLQTMKDPSKEEMLKNANITWESLPTEKIRGQYVSAKTKTFTDKEVKVFKNQTPTIINSTQLSSQFNKPIKLKGDLDPTELEEFLKEHILYGDKYKFWRYDKDQNTIMFFQVYEDKFFFKNKNGQVILYLNEKNEVISYEQTILEDMEKKEDLEVIPAFNAIVTLYDKGVLQANSKITAELGYYTLVQQTELQMLVPTWHFVVERGNVKENFYVNAIEGREFQTDNGENQTLE